MRGQGVALAKVLSGHTHGWVSISKDYRKVLASGVDLDSLLKKLHKMGSPEGYLMKAAKDYSKYIGT